MYMIVWTSLIHTIPGVTSGGYFDDSHFCVMDEDCRQVISRLAEARALSSKFDSLAGSKNNDTKSCCFASSPELLQAVSDAVTLPPRRVLKLLGVYLVTHGAPAPEVRRPHSRHHHAR
jgi:hypothetical protein